MPTLLRRASPYLLAALVGGSGVLHLVHPEPYVAIVPRALPAPEALVFASGVVELAVAAGLVAQRARRPAALATAALLVAVFPANVQMALDAEGARDRAVAYLRLPLQVPLVWWAVAVARRGRYGRPTTPQ